MREHSIHLGMDLKGGRMKRAALIVVASLSSACGMRMLEVKTSQGGFCFMCLDKPDAVMTQKLLAKQTPDAKGGK